MKGKEKEVKEEKEQKLKKEEKKEQEDRKAVTKQEGGEGEG